MDAVNRLNELSRGAELALRRHRVAPRLLLAGASWQMFELLAWIMAQPEPSIPQAGLVSACAGMYGLVIKFYQESGGHVEELMPPPTTEAGPMGFGVSK